jgi:lipopolysaccharide cholinephosphotransferase
MLPGLREIQLKELRILIFFDQICRENNIKYYLAGGTLLGAIRHKGFIPWDDDIDICMPRPDYIKILNYFQQHHFEHYILKSGEFMDLDLPFAKLFDIRVALADDKYQDKQWEKYLWIDILPVDGLPSDISDVKRIYDKLSFYRKLLEITSIRLGEGRTAFRKYCKYIIKFLVNIYGKRHIINKMERIATTYAYETSDYVGIVSWGLYGVGERMPKREFEKLYKVEFEGHTFPSFACWDAYLSGLYGDYMQLPPENKRVKHGLAERIIK